MKYISVILSMYMLSLALLPCSDQLERCISDLGANHATELTEADPHDHSSDSEDFCSPLCICTCCHTSLKTPQKPTFSLVLPFPPGNHAPSISPFLFDLDFFTDIWQPPRSLS